MLHLAQPLSQDVVLYWNARSAYVDIPISEDSEIDYTTLSAELFSQGYELMDDNECEPDLTDEGLRVYCAQRKEGSYPCVVNYDALRAS